MGEVLGVEPGRLGTQTHRLMRQTPMRATLSVVLMVKNEEARLAACLEHVAGWADEIAIIDDMSTLKKGVKRPHVCIETNGHRPP